MANATISAPPGGTQQGDFTVGITLDVGVTDMTAGKLAVTAVSGNGITGVTFLLLPDTDMDSSTYNVLFQLPEDVEGSLEIDITGTVTRVGSDTPEAVVATAVVVAYNNITNVPATFGTVEYRDGGKIAVPVTFAENVTVPSKTVFPISYVSGDALAGIEYVILGKDTAYELVSTVPPDREGAFRISGNGDVLKTASGIWDNVVVTPITVPYDTRVPRIVNYDIPENYTLGAKFDVRIALNVPATGWHANNTITEIFIEEGARLGTPTPYKWTGNTAPDFNTAVPDDLTSTDWQVLATPPGGHAGAWHGEEGKYFLIRYAKVDATATGIFNLTLRENALRGPIGS